ncbi:MAG: hypothetical protein CL789_04435 [Chloroflexi bacterium]|nr:hypothetical protein [Chloroflexota bacterium]MBS59867.1 hypothetical protein [Anaerolineaceae bacterium]HCU80895.1 hypothetical protein [Chloroflexota bacterium]
MLLNKSINNFVVHVVLSIWMLAAVSIRLRVNIYEPLTNFLKVHGLWPPMVLLQELKLWIGF